LFAHVQAPAELSRRLRQIGVVDPADGRIPYKPEAAAKAKELLAKQIYLEDIAITQAIGRHGADLVIRQPFHVPQNHQSS